MRKAAVSEGGCKCKSWIYKSYNRDFSAFKKVIVSWKGVQIFLAGWFWVVHLLLAPIATLDTYSARNTCQNFLSAQVNTLPLQFWEMNACFIDTRGVTQERHRSRGVRKKRARRAQSFCMVHLDEVTKVFKLISIQNGSSYYVSIQKRQAWRTPDDVLGAR